jgi:hypothetical protein
MTVWFDVDDLVAYFNANRRPSGIQRLCFQVYQEVWAQAGASGAIRFCRHNLHYTGLVEIKWPTLERMIRQVSIESEPDKAALIKPPRLAGADARRGSATGGRGGAHLFRLANICTCPDRGKRDRRA